MWFRSPRWDRISFQNVIFQKKWYFFMVFHDFSCLDIVCFTLLKSTGVSTLFTYFRMLMNFKKKSWKFIDNFLKKIFPKNIEKIWKIEKIWCFRFFPDFSFFRKNQKKYWRFFGSQKKKCFSKKYFFEKKTIFWDGTFSKILQYFFDFWNFELEKKKKTKKTKTSKKNEKNRFFRFFIFSISNFQKSKKYWRIFENVI